MMQNHRPKPIEEVLQFNVVYVERMRLYPEFSLLASIDKKRRTNGYRASRFSEKVYDVICCNRSICVSKKDGICR